MKELKKSLPLLKDLENRYNEIEELEKINDNLEEEREELDKLIEIIKLIDKYIDEDGIWMKNDIVKEIVDKTRFLECNQLEKDYATIIEDFLNNNFIIVDIEKNLIDMFTDREGAQDSIYEYLKENVGEFEDLVETSNLLIEENIFDDIFEKLQAEKENCINSCIDFLKEDDDMTEDEKIEIKKEYEIIFDDMIDRIANYAKVFDFGYYVYNLL